MTRKVSFITIKILVVMVRRMYRILLNLIYSHKFVEIKYYAELLTECQIGITFF